MLVDFDQYVKAGFHDGEAFTRVLGENAVEEFRQLWDFSREMTARLTWKPYMFNRRLAPLLAEVRVPALMIWGAQDAVVPVSCAHQYAAALPKSRVEIVPGAGHLVELEAPDTVVNLIANFASTL